MRGQFSGELEDKHKLGARRDESEQARGASERVRTIFEDLIENSYILGAERG